MTLKEFLEEGSYLIITNIPSQRDADMLIDLLLKHNKVQDNSGYDYDSQYCHCWINQNQNKFGFDSTILSQDIPIEFTDLVFCQCDPRDKILLGCQCEEL